MDDATGGAWFIPFPGLDQAETHPGFAGPEKRVLVAQLTSAGAIDGAIQVQVFIEGDQSAEFRDVLPFCPSGTCGGCTDETALNYDEEALYDDGNCEFGVAGCTDESACNFDDAATINERCEYAEAGLDCDGNCIDDADADGICDDVDNCSDTSACNYADTDDVACITPIGCETCSDETGTGTIVDNDQDNDNTCDDLDGCPNDPAKTAPGTCGCGAVDVDIDGDGVCDDGTDLCTEVSACNYADPSNAACINPTGCESCTNSDGTGGVDANDNDTDDNNGDQQWKRLIQFSALPPYLHFGQHL